MLIKPTLIVLLIISTFQQGLSQSLPTPQEQYEFLRWYIKQYDEDNWSDSLIHLEDENSKLYSLYSDQKIDYRITRADKQYFQKQLAFNKKYKRLNKEALPNVSWKAANNYKKGIWISMPVFSGNKKIAIINNHYYCGPLCGRYGIEIYIKINGKWKASRFNPPKAES